MSNRYFLGCLLVLMCSFIQTASAQQLSTSEILILSPVLDSSYDQTFDFLSRAKGLPVIEGFEFRTETDEMELDRQQYQLRFNFNSRDERKAYDQLLATQKNIFMLMKREDELALLSKKYKDITEIYFLDKELELIKDELLILRDRRVVYRKLLVNDSETNMKSWLSNEDDIISLMTDSLSIQNEVISLKRLLNLNEKQEIDFQDFISLDAIERYAAKLLFSSESIDNPSLDILKLKGQKFREELDLEMAETGKLLKFAQLQYQSDEDISFQREVSISTSINLPVKSTNRVKKNELALDILESERKENLELIEQRTKLQRQGDLIRSKFNEYRGLTKMVEELRLEETYEAYTSISDVSPITLLEIQKAITRNNSKELKCRKEILEIYLEIITDTGVIIKEPQMNYISNTLTTF